MTESPAVLKEHIQDMKAATLFPVFDVNRYLGYDDNGIPYFKHNIVSIRAGCGSGKTHSFFEAALQDAISNYNNGNHYKHTSILAAPQKTMLGVDDAFREKAIENDMPILYAYANNDIIGNTPPDKKDDNDIVGNASPEKKKISADDFIILQGTLKFHGASTLFNIFQCFEVICDELTVTPDEPGKPTTKNSPVIRKIKNTTKSIIYKLTPKAIEAERDRSRELEKYSEFASDFRGNDFFVNDVKRLVKKLIVEMYNEKDVSTKSDKSILKNSIKPVSVTDAEIYRLSEKDIRDALSILYSIKRVKSSKISDGDKKNAIKDAWNRFKYKDDIDVFLLNIFVRIFFPFEVSRFKSCILTMTHDKFYKSSFSMFKFSGPKDKDGLKEEELDEDDEEDASDESTQSFEGFFINANCSTLISYISEDGHNVYLKGEGEESVWSQGGALFDFLKDEVQMCMESFLRGEDDNECFFAMQEIVETLVLDRNWVKALCSKLLPNTTGGTKAKPGIFLSLKTLADKAGAVIDICEDQSKTYENFDINAIVMAFPKKNHENIELVKRISGYLRNKEYHIETTPGQRERYRRIIGMCSRILMFPSDTLGAQKSCYSFPDRYQPFFSLFIDEEMSAYACAVEKSSETGTILTTETDKSNETGQNFFGSLGTLSRIAKQCYLYNQEDVNRRAHLDNKGKERVPHFLRFGSLFLHALRTSKIKDSNFFMSGDDNVLAKSNIDVLDFMTRKLSIFNDTTEGVCIRENILIDIGEKLRSLPIEVIGSLNIKLVVDGENLLLMRQDEYDTYLDNREKHDLSLEETDELYAVSLEDLIYLMVIYSQTIQRIGKDRFEKYIVNMSTQDNYACSLYANMSKSRYIGMNIGNQGEENIVDKMSALMDVPVFMSLSVVEGLPQNSLPSGYKYVGIDMRCQGESPEQSIMRMLHNSRSRCVFMSATSHLPGSISSYYDIDGMAVVAKDYLDNPSDAHAIWHNNLIRPLRYEGDYGEDTIKIEREDIRKVMARNATGVIERDDREDYLVRYLENKTVGEALRETTRQRNAIRGKTTFISMKDNGSGDFLQLDYTQDNGDDTDAPRYIDKNSSEQYKLSSYWKPKAEDGYPHYFPEEFASKEFGRIKGKEYKRIVNCLNNALTLNQNALILANSCSSHIKEKINNQSIYQVLHESLLKGLTGSEKKKNEKAKEVIQTVLNIIKDAYQGHERDYVALIERIDGHVRTGECKKVWGQLKKIFGINEENRDQADIRCLMILAGATLETIESMVFFHKEEGRTAPDGMEMTRKGTKKNVFVLHYSAALGKTRTFRRLLGYDNPHSEDCRVIMVSPYESSKQGVNLKLRYDEYGERDLDALYFASLPYWNTVRQKNDSKNLKFINDFVNKSVFGNQCSRSQDNFVHPSNRQLVIRQMGRRFHETLSEKLRENPDFNSCCTEAKIGNQRKDMMNSVYDEVYHETCIAVVEEIIQSLGRIDRTDACRPTYIYFHEDDFQSVKTVFQRFHHYEIKDNMAGRKSVFSDSLSMTASSLMVALTDKDSPWYQPSFFISDDARTEFEADMYKLMQEHEEASRYFFRDVIQRHRSNTEENAKYAWMTNFNRAFRSLFCVSHIPEKPADFWLEMKWSFFGNEVPSNGGIFGAEDWKNLRECIEGEGQIKEAFVILLSQMFLFMQEPEHGFDYRLQFPETIHDDLEAFVYSIYNDIVENIETKCFIPAAGGQIPLQEGEMAGERIAPYARWKKGSDGKSYLLLSDGLNGAVPYNELLIKHLSELENICIVKDTNDVSKSKKDKYSDDSRKGDSGKTIEIKEAENTYGACIKVHNDGGKEKKTREILLGIGDAYITEYDDYDNKLNLDIRKALGEAWGDTAQGIGNRIVALKKALQKPSVLINPAVLPSFKGNIAEEMIREFLTKFVKREICNNKLALVKPQDNLVWGIQRCLIEEYYDLCLVNKETDQAIFIDVKAYRMGINGNQTWTPKSSAEKERAIRECRRNAMVRPDDKCDMKYLMLNVYDEPYELFEQYQREKITDEGDRNRISLGFVLNRLNDDFLEDGKKGNNKPYAFNPIFVDTLYDIIKGRPMREEET